MRKALLVIALVTGMGCTQFAAAQAATQPASRPLTATVKGQPTTTQAAPDEEATKRTVEKRTAEVLKVLALTDPAKQARVHDILSAFFTKRITWGPNDDKIKDLDKQLAKANLEKDEVKAKELEAQLTALKAELAALRDAFLADLAKELTPEQIMVVKDTLTYGKVKIMVDAACAKVELDEAQKGFVLRTLTDAREQAWMAGSASDKHQIFDKANGRVNNYLDALKKLREVSAHIQAGRLGEAQQVLDKLDKARPWLKEAIAAPLADAHKALEAARAAGASSQPVGR